MGRFTLCSGEGRSPRWYYCSGLRRSTMLLAGLLTLVTTPALGADNTGLLFYQSFDKSLTADVAQGDAVPNFADKIKLVPNGRSGSALSTADDNVLAWKAPGNIYAQRGTVSFFWRAREPLGRAPFVIFRVGYADHTSWDMVWLRIDYNGHGYDAFVTDNNLARIRVSFTLDQLPAPDAWTHLAFAWDETQGVTLYVNGKEVAGKAQPAVLDSGLDQFGMAARAVSPHQVQSRYNFMRGSDYDELRIYDHALEPAQIVALARNESIQVAAQPAGDLNTPATRAEWDWRYGWNRKGDLPPELTAPVTTIRKVEFADAKDIKEWMYKATDGIAETTWPGVYNRSRLPGRNDYFPLPDWNVYVDGGKTLTLTLPNEPFNRMEIQGAAYGSLTYAADEKATATTIATRAKDQERTFHSFAQTRTGGVLRFTNIAQETPIQEIAAYNINDGAVPKGTVTQSYTIRAAAAPDSPDIAELNAFITKRYTPDERATVVALPDAAPSRPRAADTAHKLPLVHILIPYEYGASPPGLPLYRSWGYGWENMHDGLDGIAIELPPLNTTPAANGLIPLNIQIKDPIWPERNMMDVSVSVRPNTPRTLWLDLRDRILPNKSFYLTITSASADFSAAALDGAKIKLVFKDRHEALKEHIADRFNQVKDNWGYLVEEHTASKREHLYDRLVTDITDLLRVDPDNKLALEYWNDITYRSQGALAYTQPKPPAGVPLWAFRQLEDLKYVRQFVNWWIDNRQADYGDFGGGLSDDSDLVEQWPGLALMGVDSEKLRVSQMRVADAIYRNGMFTNGLATLMLDELHAYEDGINTNSEAMYLNYGDPKVVERLMTTVKAYDRIISVNAAGHLHFNTNWYSGTDSYREGPFEWGKYYSYTVLHPSILMAEYNGDPTGKRFVTGLADGILAHGKQDKDGHWHFPDEINWRTDATRGKLPAGTAPMHLFWAAYKWTNDTKYLRPIIASVEQANSEDSTSVGGARVAAEKENLRPLTNFNEDMVTALGKQESWGQWAVHRAANGGGNLDRYEAWEMTGDLKYLEDLYASEMARAATTMYSQTAGHWWTDRVEVDSQWLQHTRLGGVALTRGNITPGATVSWGFADPQDAVKVAFLLPTPARDHFKVIAFNTSDHPITATMTGWNVTAGQWSLRSGEAGPNDALPVAAPTQSVPFEKAASIPLIIPPGKTYVYEMRLTTPIDPVETRPDIGIGADDVKLGHGALSVTVHSLGAKPTPAGRAELIDAVGKIIASTAIPALAAPTDLMPHTNTVELKLPHGFDPKGCRVHISLGETREVTLRNNDIELRAPLGR